MGLYFSLLPVWCPWAVGLPRTVSPNVTVLWSSGMSALLTTRAGQSRCVPFVVCSSPLALVSLLGNVEGRERSPGSGRQQEDAWLHMPVGFSSAAGEYLVWVYVLVWAWSRIPWLLMLSRPSQGAGGHYSLPGSPASASATTTCPPHPSKVVGWFQFPDCLPVLECYGENVTMVSTSTSISGEYLSCPLTLQISKWPSLACRLGDFQTAVFTGSQGKWDHTWTL